MCLGPFCAWVVLFRDILILGHCVLGPFRDGLFCMCISKSAFSNLK